MQYEVWKKWYHEAIANGDSKNIKRLRKIGILHGWVEVKRGRRANTYMER